MVLEVGLRSIWPPVDSGVAAAVGATPEAAAEQETADGIFSFEIHCTHNLFIKLKKELCFNHSYIYCQFSICT